MTKHVSQNLDSNFSAFSTGRLSLRPQLNPLLKRFPLGNARTSDCLLRKQLLEGRGGFFADGTIRPTQLDRKLTGSEIFV
jgi:hypothetical protein